MYPATTETYTMSQLTHLDRRLAGSRTEPAMDPDGVGRVLHFIHWGLVGDGPYEDADAGSCGPPRCRSDGTASADRSPSSKSGSSPSDLPGGTTVVITQHPAEA